MKRIFAILALLAAPICAHAQGQNFPGGSGSGISSVTVLPALPCPEGTTNYLNTASGVNPRGNYTCTNGKWVLSGNTNFNVTSYGAVGDGISLFGCTVGNNSPTVTCATGNFQAADVGKVVGTSAAFNVIGGTSITIASRTSSTVVNLSQNSIAASGGFILTYGTNNFTAFQNAMTVALGAFGLTVLGASPASIFPTIDIPCGRYMAENTSTLAGVFDPRGVATGTGVLMVRGCGIGSTEIIPTNGTQINILIAGPGTLFNATNTSNVGLTLRDITLNGVEIPYTATGIVWANLSNASNASNNIIENVEGESFIAGNSAPISIVFSGIGIARRVNVHDTSGQYIGIQYTGDVITEYTFANNIFIGYDLNGLTSFRGFADSIDNCTSTTFGCMEIRGASNNIRIVSSDFVLPTNGGVSLVMEGSVANARLDMLESRCIQGGANGYFFGFGTSAVQVVHFQEAKMCAPASGTGAAIILKQGSQAYLDGGNTFTGGVSPIVNGSGGGNIFSDAAVYGLCTGTVPAGATIGFYGTGQNVTTTACATTIGNGVQMKYPGTLIGFQGVATTGGVNASSGLCTVSKATGGGALTNTTLTFTFGTGTTGIDATHTVSFLNGDLISVNCTTQAADTLAGVRTWVIVLPSV